MFCNMKIQADFVIPIGYLWFFFCDIILDNGKCAPYAPASAIAPAVEGSLCRSQGWDPDQLNIRLD